MVSSIQLRSSTYNPVQKSQIKSLLPKKETKMETSG